MRSGTCSSAVAWFSHYRESFQVLDIAARGGRSCPKYKFPVRIDTIVVK